MWTDGVMLGVKPRSHCGAAAMHGVTVGQLCECGVGLSAPPAERAQMTASLEVDLISLIGLI